MKIFEEMTHVLYCTGRGMLARLGQPCRDWPQSPSPALRGLSDLSPGVDSYRDATIGRPAGRPAERMTTVLRGSAAPRLERRGSGPRKPAHGAARPHTASCPRHKSGSPHPLRAEGRGSDVFQDGTCATLARGGERIRPCCTRTRAPTVWRRRRAAATTARQGYFRNR